MKKVFLSMLLMVIGCASAMAGSDFKVTEGSLAPLKDGGTATVSINMTDTKFDNKMPLREDGRFEDVDKNLPEYHREFIREFNEHAKKFRCVESDGEYAFTLDISNLDVYVNVFSFKGGIGTKIWGTLTITDKAGAKVAVITLDKFESSGINYNVSLEETYEVLAKNLAKRINKGK